MRDLVSIVTSRQKICVWTLLHFSQKVLAAVATTYYLSNVRVCACVCVFLVKSAKYSCEFSSVSHHLASLSEVHS